jgi:hypothetical protein
LYKKPAGKVRVYVLENTLPPPGGEYQPMSFGGKDMKGRIEKGGKCKTKKKKEEEKGRKGKKKRKGEVKR